MLLELSIVDFAIIDRLRISFAPGLNVLTGETGAGKSILIDAVNILLGARAGPELVRAGAEQARIEGIFALPRPPDDSPADTPNKARAAGEDSSVLSPLLEEYGASGDEDAIILCREIHRAGRTAARINGRTVPVSLLQQVGKGLVDVHGQGDHLSLLNVGQHSLLLDRYGGLLQQRLAFSKGVGILRQVRREIETLLRDERAIARQVDLLQFQVDEISTAGLAAGEEEALASEHNLLSHAEQLAGGARAVFELLQGGAGDNRPALDSVGEALRQMGPLAKLDPSLAGLLRSLEEASYQLEDAAAGLRRYVDTVEFNPLRLQAVDDRLDLIHRLKRKYGSSLEEVLRFGEAASAELDAIAHGEDRMNELRHREAELVAELGSRAASLSVTRLRCADRLAADAERELADLNMRGTRFSVACERTKAPEGLPDDEGNCYAYDNAGIDRIEFLVSTNTGEPLRPLNRIASGGETSRLMLAMKTILSNADGIPTLIFDEIDVGIGGRSGQVVGQKLWNLGARHQVLCVTHLPQIACFADAHFQISKQIGERTVTQVRQLDGETRLDEIAVMLGGLADSSTALENARDLVNRAISWKEQHGPVRAGQSLNV